MQVYCTLFDSNYLDKGLVLYRSLCRCETDFRLYVFAFDELCHQILKQEDLEHLVIIPLEAFETPELLKIKGERTRAEYCWTCTPWIIKYVLEQCGEPECTYIDADMMFFSSPQYIFDDMRARGCSVMITPHRMGKSKKERAIEAHVGKYCVEFNTFLNNGDGHAALDWWAEQCLEWCYYTPRNAGTIGYGDQKYLDEFEEKFRGVYVCNEYGAGIGPWNARQLELVEGSEAPWQVRVRTTGKTYPLVFCHFAMITHLSQHYINVASGVTDPALHRVLYDYYVAETIRERAYLGEKYGLDFYLRRKVTNNLLRTVYHRFVAPFIKIRRLSDIYKV